MRRRRLVRKRFLTGCFIMLLFVAILTGRSMLTSMAEEEPMTVSPYYKSVEIKDGDKFVEYRQTVQKGKPYVYRRIHQGIKTNEIPFALIRFIKGQFSYNSFYYK